MKDTSPRRSGAWTRILLAIFPWILSAAALAHRDCLASSQPVPAPQRPQPPGVHAFEVEPGNSRVDATTLSSVQQLTTAGLAELRPAFGNPVVPPFRVIAHADLESMPAAVRGQLHRGTAGLALLHRREIHLILEEARQQPPFDLGTVVRHELVHILLHDWAGDAAEFVPRWVHEGLAQALSGKLYLGASEDLLLFRAQTDRLLSLANLRRRFPEDRDELRAAYAQSFSFVSFLIRAVGLDRVLAATRNCVEETWFRGGFFRTTDEALINLEEEWRDYLARDSGAGMRFVLENCFSYLMVLAIVLLALAGIRVWNRDHEAQLRLEREAQAADNNAFPTTNSPPENDRDDRMS